MIWKRHLAKGRYGPLMKWALGLSLSSILVLSLTGVGVILAGERGGDADRRDRATTRNAAKARKKAKATQSGSKLIDERNVNRGADGTVSKAMNRGPPLKKLLPEDIDDEEEWDDDKWYEDDEERPYEEKQLEAERLNAKAKAAAAAEEEEEEEEAGAPEGAERSERGGGDDAPPTSNSEPEEKRRPAPANAEAMKERVVVKGVPRNRESNAAAVMKIVDSDARPGFGQTLTRDGKIVKDKEDSSSEDSSEDSEDSDDEEEEEEDESTYLPLPNLATLAPDAAAAALLDSISRPFQKRLSSMFEKATSHECRAEIAEHAALFLNGLAEETKLPFDDFHYPNTCEAIPRYADWDNLPEGVRIQDIQYRTYQPPREEAEEGAYIENVEDLLLVYVILTHDLPEATIRLMESVHVEGVTKFVVHVDGKEKSDATYERLVEYARERNDQAIHGDKREEYIRIVPNEKRVRVNWGGFSMVDATLKALHTLFGLDHYDDHPDEEGRDDRDNPHAFPFHKLVHLASTTYPVASNTEIRDTLSSFPLDANFLHIILRPNNPTPSVWNYFVECDDALHRIYRLPALNFDRGNGVDVYTSSQWFVVSREFAWYLASPPEGSFVERYLGYAEHVVVADEAFFGTVIRNTHFCAKLHNDNFLHLTFDRWENEATGARDERKCIMKNRDHCGRSPTTMTVEYLPVLELSGDLFARKFDDDAEPLIKDYIDKRRRKEEERLQREANITNEMKEDGSNVTLPLEDWQFQGEGVLIVAKETLSDDVPLCMGLAKEGNKVMLQPCFLDDVLPTLSPGWEEGAVIVEELDGFNRWDIGPCSSDGQLKFNDTGIGALDMVPGEYSETGPSCGIKLADGPRSLRCLDVDSERFAPGGPLNVYPCYTRWHQMFSFGNGTVAPRGAVHVSLQAHVARELKKKKKEGEEVHRHLCLGVEGRGNMEEPWIEYEEEEMEELDPWEKDDVDVYPNGRKSLQLWSGQQLQTTPCSNEGGVIEWFYIPFIVEEYDHDVEESPEGAVEDEAKESPEGTAGDEVEESSEGTAEDEEEL